MTDPKRRGFLVVKVDLHDASLVVGGLLVVAGVALWSPPAATIVAGVFVITLSVLSASTTKVDPPTPRD